MYTYYMYHHVLCWQKFELSELKILIYAMEVLKAEHWFTGLDICPPALAGQAMNPTGTGGTMQLYDKHNATESGNGNPSFTGNSAM